MKKAKKVKQQKPSFFKNLNEQMRQKKSTFAVYTVLRALVIVALVRFIITFRFESAFICAITLVLMILPSLLEKHLRIELPSTLEIIILLFIFAAEILGEIEAYYIKFAFWDTMLHTINGFLCAAVGFALLDIINRDSKIKFNVGPLYLSIVAFCFSMTIGVLWEFGEFSLDYLFHTDAQKDTVLNSISTVMLDPNGENKAVTVSGITDVIVNGQSLGLGGYLDIGLYDTMKDLFVNFIGAAVFSVIGFFYVKNRGKGKFAKRFIPTIKEIPEDTETDTKAEEV